MSLTLVNKIAGTIDDGTNSYCDQPYADDYFFNHWNQSYVTAWQALADQSKAPLLVAATRVLETARFVIPILRTDWRFHRYYNRMTMQVMNFQLLREPVKWYFYQQLQFPRNLDISTTTGLTYIPPAVLMAQCEQAMYMLTFDQTYLSKRMQGIVNDTTSIGKGQIHLNQQYGAEGSQMSPQAYEFIKPYLVRGQKMRRA